jgi:hypothetical protein
MPLLYAFEEHIRRLTLPVLIVVGDEDDACIEPSLFLKQNIPASGLAMFPKTGHILNLEEPALFNETLERFLALAEADRWPPARSCLAACLRMGGHGVSPSRAQSRRSRNVRHGKPA